MTNVWKTNVYTLIFLITYFLSQLPQIMGELELFLMYGCWVAAI